jgi:hypothetical protein
LGITAGRSISSPRNRTLINCLNTQRDAAAVANHSHGFNTQHDGASLTNPWPAFNIQRVAFSSANITRELNTPHHAAPLTTTPRELGRDSVSGGLVGGSLRLATHHGTLVMREDSLMGTRWTRRRRVHGRPTSCILIRRRDPAAPAPGSTATCILQRFPVITIITGAGRAG